MGSFQGTPDHIARMEQLKRFIGAHIDEPLQRGVLASAAGFSVPHLNRIFLDQVGESIATYVRRTRLERAGRKLMMGAVDIAEVALAAGYDTHAAFAKAFKRQFGMSPSEFRRLDTFLAIHILRKGNGNED